MISESMSIARVLEHHAQNQPDKPAFIFVDETLKRRVLTRQQVWDYCRKFAAVLRRKGLGRGHVVCNALPNCPERIICEFGAITGGAISMNAQTCKVDGLDFISSLNTGKVSAVIANSEEVKGVFTILKSKLEQYDEETGEVSCPDVPSLKYILTYPLIGDKRNKFFEDLDKEDEMVHEDIDPEDVCQYMCTSGSTAFFKLVAFCGRGLQEYGRHYAETLSIADDDVFMNNRLLGWAGGYPTVYIAIGSTRVVMDLRNGLPKNFSDIQWRVAVQEKCTVIFTAPLFLTEFKAIRENSKTDELRKYKARIVGSGGGPTTTKQVRAALECASKTVVTAYASTEAGFITLNRFTSVDEVEEFNTGLPTSDTEVKVVDKDGEEVPCGVKGEIFIKSTQAAVCYVNDPEKTSETFRSDGWIRLGDIGMLNSKGQLFVVGRNKFAILRGSIVFYPDVVESFIRECPGVKDVAVTGVPDENLFEQICALIIKEPDSRITADDVEKFCKDSIYTQTIKSLAPVPKYFLFVDAFPMSGTGKLERLNVKNLACEMLNLEPNKV